MSGKIGKIGKIGRSGRSDRSGMRVDQKWTASGVP